MSESNPCGKCGADTVEEAVVDTPYLQKVVHTCPSCGNTWGSQLRSEGQKKPQKPEP